MTRRSSATSSSDEGGAEPAVEQPRVARARRASSASATSTVRLPSDRSSPAGLPGHVGVAEDAEQVVAQLERLAERQPEAGQRLRARRRPPRRARRRRAAAARWSTSRTCSAAPASPGRRRTSPRACTDTSRNWPAITSLRVVSKNPSASRTDVVVEPAACAAARRTRTAAGRRAGSPPPRRTAPGRRPSPCSRWQRLEGPVGGGPAAPGVGGVHVVVVDQRAGVQQLQRARPRGPARASSGTPSRTARKPQ